MFGSRLEFFPIREEQDGIEIALNGAAMLKIAPTFVERDAPIEADNISFGFIHRGEQRGAVSAKVNDGSAGFPQGLDKCR